MLRIPATNSYLNLSTIYSSISTSLFSGSHWSKTDKMEREIEKEREKEREVVLGLDRWEERERYYHWCIFDVMICVCVCLCVYVCVCVIWQKKLGEGLYRL